MPSAARVRRLLAAAVAVATLAGCQGGGHAASAASRPSPTPSATASGTPHDTAPPSLPDTATPVPFPTPPLTKNQLSAAMPTDEAVSGFRYSRSLSGPYSFPDVGKSVSGGSACRRLVDLGVENWSAVNSFDPPMAERSKEYVSRRNSAVELFVTLSDYALPNLAEEAVMGVDLVTKDCPRMTQRRDSTVTTITTKKLTEHGLPGRSVGLYQVYSSAGREPMTSIELMAQVQTTVIDVSLTYTGTAGWPMVRKVLLAEAARVRKARGGGTAA